MAATLRPHAQSPPRRREQIAWLLVVIQACVIFLFASPASFCDDDGRGGAADRRRLAAGKEEAAATPGMNGRSDAYYERQRLGGAAKAAALSPSMFETSLHVSPDSSLHDKKASPSFEPPEVVDAADARFARRIWRSRGAPSVHPDLQSGSCWCSADDWCACTPALAVDLVLRSGDAHIWVVRRADTGLLALMGGFTEVGETSEETVHRELREEMGFRLDAPPALFGVYNDPRRDARRHTTSVVYVADIPATATPKAGDDATQVIRLPVADIDKHEYFVDHKTILHDYVAMLKSKKRDEDTPQELETSDSHSTPFKRSVCPM